MRSARILLCSGLVIGLSGVAASPGAMAASGSFLSSPALDAHVILQSFSFFEPYDSAMYGVLGKNAKALKNDGITDVWMPPPYRALPTFMEEGYAVTDRYDLGQFPAGHGGATATKYGTSSDLANALSSLHAQGLNVQADIVPNQLFLPTKEVIPVTATDNFGNPDLARADVTHRLYEVYSKGGGAGQGQFGTFPQWNSSRLNGASTQSIGIDRVMVDSAGTAFRYFGPGNAQNHLPDWLANTPAAANGEINNYNSYLSVDGYYAVAGEGTSDPTFRPLLLHYIDPQPGAATQNYLDYMRANGFPGPTDDDVRNAIIAAPTATVTAATDAYLLAQPGYSAASETGIQALRFDKADNSDVNKNVLQYEFLLGDDVDNSNPSVQEEQLNWERFLLDTYHYDGFRWDAAGHYNTDILRQAAALFSSRYPTAPNDHLNYIESYVSQQVPFENSNGNGQLAYDAVPYTSMLNTLGKSNPTEPLSDTITTSLVNRVNPGPGDVPIPNWSFVTNHDQEHNVIATIPLTPEQAGGATPGDKQWQLAQYKIYTADRAQVNKQFAPYNVPSAYALLLTNKDTVPTVFYGDLWQATDTYMKHTTPYFDSISKLLDMRKDFVSGPQHVTSYTSNTSGTPGQDLIASVREGTSRATGVGVVISDNPAANTTITVDMGSLHAKQAYVDALGFHKETLTTDAAGTLTVPVAGTKNVQVNGYLGAWVPKDTKVVKLPKAPKASAKTGRPTAPSASAPTTTKLLVAQPTVAFGDTTRLIATVDVGASGTITFKDGSRTLGEAPVVKGVATLETPPDLAVGGHQIEAVYSGDHGRGSSQSSPQSLTVK